MRQIDAIDYIKVRNPGRPDEEAGVVMPKRLPGSLFQGWGPKLLAAALTVGALTISEPPAKADAIAQTACADRGATLISAPSFSAPQGAIGNEVTVLRISLSARGELEHVAVAQSSGDALLDLEAIRVAHASRYAAAMVHCEGAAETVLYRVEF